jgi:shikimate kinase
MGFTMKTIFLIGFMGSGKTTVGELLAKKLGLPVFDMDVEIVGYAGKSVNDIFHDHGEGFFRELESTVLRNFPNEDIIVSTGGGTILKEENRIWMKENGSVVFLEASADEILERLKDDTTRPLLEGDKEKEINERLGKRMPLYKEAADIRILTDGKNLEEIIEEIMRSLNISAVGHTC